MAVRDYFCSLHHNAISQEILEKYDNLLPDAYRKAEPMLTLSKAIADSTNSPIIMFPFDYMAEAEAMGYQVKGYDDNFGLRSSGALAKNVTELKNLPAIDFGNGRINQILQAIALANQNGYTACLSLSGFVTVADILLSLEKICTSWRNQRDELFSFWQNFSDELVTYATLAQNAGAQLFSYSDPLAAASIIGPKWAQEIIQELVTPLLHKLLAIPGGSIIHLCGKTSYVLEDAGLITLESITLPEPMGYQQAVLSQINKSSIKGKIILGHGCLNSNPTVSAIKKIILL